MQQLVSPNLDPYIPGSSGDWFGWCLGYVRAAFNAPYAGAMASNGWEMAEFKHEDRNFPTGVYFPMWFYHWGTYLNSATGKYWTGNWGHVVIGYVHPETGAINIWSSPTTHTPFAKTWSSVGEIERNYSATFTGWSEDISGMQIIKENSNMIDKNSTNSLRIIHSEVGGWDMGSAHDGSSDALFHGAWDGHTYDEFIYAQWSGSGVAFRAKRIEAIDYFDNKRPQVEQQVKDLTVQVAELTRALKIKNDLVDKLDAQVAVQSGDTQLLNGFGVWLSRIIVRLGVKG